MVFGNATVMKSGKAFVMNIPKNVCAALDIKEPGWIVEFDMRKLKFVGVNPAKGKKTEKPVIEEQSAKAEIKLDLNKPELADQSF